MDPDPDMHGSAFILVDWIRISIRNTGPGPDPGGLKWHKSEGKVLKDLRDEDFSCSLDVLMEA